MKYTREYLEDNLIIGAKIKVGRNYAAWAGFKEGEIIELVNGQFEYDNGLYTEDQYAPSYDNKETNDYDSIYHLFGNDLDEFGDCEIL